MKSSYILSCCSTADLSKEDFLKKNISYICFHFSLNNTIYKDDLGESIAISDFYQAMRDGAETKTSQVNVGEFVEYFTSFLEKGLDIFHVCLSSGLSGVYNSANIAKEELKEKYPDRNIYIVDSLAASSGYGLLMSKLADLKDKGYSMQELLTWTDLHKLELHHWFFSTDLSFYVKGGRISKISGFVGTALNICPLLNVNNTGHLIPRFKVRGKKKVIKEIVNKMEEFAADGKLYQQECYLSHSDCLEDAKEVAALIEESFPKLKGKIKIYNVGTTIGSHTGPGTVALFFWGTKRTA